MTFIEIYLENNYQKNLLAEVLILRIVNLYLTIIMLIDIICRLHST